MNFVFYSLIGFFLLLQSTSLSAFSFQDFNGRCGDVKLFVGPVEGNKLAVTDADQTGGYITLDPQLIQSVSQDALTFVYFHECGHRINGDRSSGYRSYDAEQKADCYAANRYKEEYGERAFHTVLDDLLSINGHYRNNQILECETQNE